MTHSVGRLLLLVTAGRGGVVWGRVAAAYISSRQHRHSGCLLMHHTLSHFDTSPLPAGPPSRTHLHPSLTDSLTYIYSLLTLWCRYNPQDVGRASLLLGSGAVLGRRFQPYEAHIPFLLQLKVGVGGWVCAGERGRGEGSEQGWMRVVHSFSRQCSAPHDFCQESVLGRQRQTNPCCTVCVCAAAAAAAVTG